MPARCAPNEDGAVLLRDILDSFNAPIKEEHAWALCYQCAKCFGDALRYKRDKCFNVSDVAHVWVHGDGTVHQSTIFAGGGVQDSHRRIVSSEKELVIGLGVLIFKALDVGYNYGEEREMSRELEELIDLMTTEVNEQTTDGEPHQETDDEGIERDSGDADEYTPGPSHPSDLRHHQQHHHHSPFTLTNVLEICARHVDVQTWEQADTHYRAVCRALVAEALELATFLEKVSTGTRELRLTTDSETCKDLDQLNFQDWARFWVQVIGELRMGVKLKKVDHSRTPIEFELTPYEILMDDIRSRRYKLKKIMIDGNIPQRVKKDAHALILEFIRSRPPLRKVSERKLSPLKRVPTPREQLLDSIKSGKTLKPTVNKLKARLLPPVQNETPKSRKEELEDKKPTRRLIKVDFSVLQGDDDEDDDDEGGYPSCSSDVNSSISTKGGQSSPNPWRRTGSRTTHITHDEYHHFCDTALECRPPK